MFWRWKRAHPQDTEPAPQDTQPAPQDSQPAPQDTQPAAQIGPVHTLSDNDNLSAEQHARCVDWIGRLQEIYDNAEAYRDRHGLDSDLVFAGNEWADLVDRTGLRFRTAYSDVNYLRLHAPFAGYYLAILDRMDERRFPDDWGAEIVSKLGVSIPDDVVDVLAKRLPFSERLAPLVPEHLDHVRNVPARYVVRAPRMLGEIGIDVDGVLVNADVILSQSRINGMLCSGVLDKLDAAIARRGRARVLEIGSGYGAMGHALKAIFGDRLEYVAVDLPSSLYYSMLYLGATCNWNGCHLLRPGDKVPERFNFLFVANYLLSEFADSLGPIDLAFNCMSFPEMSAAQVKDYAAFLKRALRDDGVVFDENFAFKPHHVDSKAILSEVFPFRQSVSSSVVTTKNWCQDVWSSRHLDEIHDRQ